MNVVSELSLLTCYKQNWLQWLNCRRLDSHDLQNSPSRKFSVESEHTRNCEVKRNSIFKDTWTIVPFPIAMGLWNITQAKCKQVSSTTGKTISTAAELTELFSEIPLSVSSLLSCCYEISKSFGTWRYFRRPGLIYCQLKLVEAVFSASNPEQSSRQVLLL